MKFLKDYCLAAIIGSILCCNLQASNDNNTVLSWDPYVENVVFANNDEDNDYDKKIFPQINRATKAVRAELDSTSELEEKKGYTVVIYTYFYAGANLEKKMLEQLAEGIKSRLLAESYTIQQLEDLNLDSEEQNPANQTPNPQAQTTRDQDPNPKDQYLTEDQAKVWGRLLGKQPLWNGCSKIGVRICAEKDGDGDIEKQKENYLLNVLYIATRDENGIITAEQLIGLTQLVD